MSEHNALRQECEAWLDMNHGADRSVVLDNLIRFAKQQQAVGIRKAARFAGWINVLDYGAVGDVCEATATALEGGGVE